MHNHSKISYEAATKMIYGWESAQHEELYYRLTVLGSLRTTDFKLERSQNIMVEQTSLVMVELVTLHPSPESKDNVDIHFSFFSLFIQDPSL